MKRLLFVLLTSVFIFGSCTEELVSGNLSVAPENLKFAKVGEVRTLAINTRSAWTIEVLGGEGWLTVDPLSGRGNGRPSVTAAMNPALERTATINISAGGATVAVSVTQEGLVLDENIVPDAASGIVVDPVKPDADGPCSIKFNAPKDSELFGYTGDLYAHLGLIVDDEWAFVPAAWDENIDKCKFSNVGENAWELKIEPSVREFFGSGETPVTKMAMVIRSADGTLQTRPDQFNSIKDNKYQIVPFIPDPVVDESLPADVKPGINIHDDNSVTFVLYAQDTDNNMHDYCYLVGDWNQWERNAGSSMKRDKESGCWWLTVTGFDPATEYRYQFRLGNQPASDICVSDPYTEIVYDQWNDKYLDGVPVFPEGAKALVSAFQIERPSYSWRINDFKIEDKRDLVIYELLFRDFSTTKDIAGAVANFDHIKNLGVNAVELMPVQEFDGNSSWGYNPNHYFALDKAYGTREEYKQFIDLCHENGIAVIIDVVYNHTFGSHTWAKMWWDSKNNRTAANNPWYNAIARHPYNVGHDFNHGEPMVKEHVKQSLEYLLKEYKVDGFRFDLTKGFTQKNTGENVAAWSQKDDSRIAILKDYADYIWSVKNDAVVIFEHLSEPDEEEILANHGIQLWRNVNENYRSAVTGGTGNFKDMYSTSPFGGYVGYMESHDEERLCYGASDDVSSIVWGVIGIGGDWDNDKKMAVEGDLFVVKNVMIDAKDEFKIRKAGVWNNNYNYGASSENFKLAAGQGYKLINGGSSKNIGVQTTGTYDIYFSYDHEIVWLMQVGQKPNYTPVAKPETSEEALSVAMRRAGASAAFFLTVPGPKMIWQFGEIGYDLSINYPSGTDDDRTSEKPVKTDEYMKVPERKALYDTYVGLIKFRRDNPRFFDADAKFDWDPDSEVKTIMCTVDSKRFHVVGNFAKEIRSYSVPAGQWKDYFNNGAEVSGNITLKPGEFLLLTDYQ